MVDWLLSWGVVSVVVSIFVGVALGMLTMSDFKLAKTFCCWEPFIAARSEGSSIRVIEPIARVRRDTVVRLVQGPDKERRANASIKAKA